MFKSFLLEIFLSCSVLIQLLFNTKLINKFTLNYLLLDGILYSQISFILFSLLILSTTILSEFYSFNLSFINTENLVLIKSIIILILLISLKLILSSFSLQKLNFHEFISLFLLSILASFLIISSKDLISFYLSVEMQSLCFYLLACFKRDSVFSSEAGLKYFIGSSFMSGIFLLGCSLIYGAFGTLNLVNTSLLTSFDVDSLLNGYLIVGFTLVTFFLLYKTVAVPFHFLYPDVYEGAPLSSTIIFNLLPYFSIYYFFYEWINILNIFFPEIQLIVIFCSLLSIITGTFFAISQLRLKRLVIYSSIAQTGFLLSSLSCGLTNSIVVVYFYLIIYLITSFLIWGFIYTFLKFKNSSSWCTDLNPLLISSFVKLFKFNKVLSFSFVLIFFSMAGIPPLVGFISKILILQELLSNSFYFIAIFLIVISSISVFYYIRIIKTIYFEPIETKKNNFVFFFNDSLKLQNLYISFSICLFLLSFLSFTPEFILIFLNIIFQ